MQIVQRGNVYVITGNVTLIELSTLIIPNYSVVDMSGVSHIEDLAVIFLRNAPWKVTRSEIDAWDHVVQILEAETPEGCRGVVKAHQKLSFGRFLINMWKGLRYSELAQEVTWRELYDIGRKTIFASIAVSVVLGVAVTMQILVYIRTFGLGLEQFSPTILAFVIVNHLGPLVGAQLLSSQYASAIAADIASSRMNEEWDGLISMGHNPYTSWCWPRVFASTIMTTGIIFLLTILLLLASAVCLSLNLQDRSFFEIARIIRQTLSGDSGFVMVIVRGIVFGLVIPVVALYQGCSGDLLKGVGECATQAVYYTSVATITAHVMIAVIVLLFQAS